MSDPKLIDARDRIKEILEENDIAGIFVLHNCPGQSEALVHLTPSYSKLFPVSTSEGTAYRLRSNRAEYGEDRAAQIRDLAATANMVSSIGALTAQMGLYLVELAISVDKKTGASHTELQEDK